MWYLKWFYEGQEGIQLPQHRRIQDDVRHLKRSQWNKFKVVNYFRQKISILDA